MSRRILILVCFAAALLSPSICLGAEGTSPKIQEAYGKLPLSFEANRGQVASGVDFVARGDGYSLFLAPTEAVFALRNAAPQQSPGRPNDSKRLPGRSHLLRLKLIGAKARPSVEGRDELGGKVNYLTGSDPAQWHTDIPTYQRVHYQEVYPGIDLVYYGNQRQLEYDFIVAPGADWRQVALRFSGADRVTVDPTTGDLVVQVGKQIVRQRKPIIYQKSPEGRREIKGRYALRKGGRIGFEVGEYDATRPLVIDPVLVYSTYLGGSLTEVPGGIAVDSAGNVYVTGQTDSADFPLKDPLQSTHFTPFVTKINPEGNALVYSSYFGTGAVDAQDIGVDSAGSVYLTGEAGAGGIPIVNAIQSNFGGGELDAFLTKINPAGNGLIYSTYLGGAGSERGLAIAVDGAGNAYVTGYTDSLNFPTVNPRQASNAGYDDVFITKINPSGSTLVFSTYLGGEFSEFGNAIAVDPAGNIHVCGTTFSSNFPTVNAIQGTDAGDDEAIVAKLSPGGDSLLYSTYLGGSEREYGQGIAADSLGNTYVTGITRSGDFPVTTQAFDKTHSGDGGTDGFVTKINAAGNALVYSSFLGGTSVENSRSIAVDSNGAAYVTGSTTSVDFPIVNPLQSTTDAEFPEWHDGFLTKVNPAGDALLFSTYLGGVFDDFPSRVVVDAAGDAYVLGLTFSPDFPILNAVKDVVGDYDVFITKIRDSPGGAVIVKKLANVSTRLFVGTNEKVLIAGFIVTGSASRKVGIRGIGPSLSGFGFPTLLADPILEVYRGNQVIAANDNWRDSQEAEIEASKIPPTNNAESMVIINLDPGAYTAIVRGKDGGTGIGLAEVYDLRAGTIGSELANLSTRGFVQTGNDVMIGGFIIGGGGATTRIAVRAIGPSLLGAGVSGALADPILEVRNQDGFLVAVNDNWKQSQQAEIEASQLAPGNDLESVIITAARTGQHTAIVRGKDNSTGVGLVEVYNLH
jgi:hypothetical protein